MGRLTGNLEDPKTGSYCGIRASVGTVRRSPVISQVPIICSVRTGSLGLDAAREPVPDRQPGLTMSLIISTLILPRTLTISAARLKAQSAA